jgi:predicted nucleic acid-binding protein
MPESKDLVINTGPIITLVAALGELSVLKSLYQRVVVPFEVCREILAGGHSQFAVPEFEDAAWLYRRPSPIQISPILLNSLDRGEAAVIQVALIDGIRTVCIDESMGRRVARLHDLSVTGSIGILLKAKEHGYPFSMREALQKMSSSGIWLSNNVVDFALFHAGERD